MKGNQATDFLQYKDRFYDINFSAPIYNNRLIIKVQDLKYAKKNSRNNVHSGVRLLVLGKDTVRYDQILAIAKVENSALFIRDVVNIKKQDDGAAYRFFSSSVLTQCQEDGIISSDKLDLFVYLFVISKFFIKIIFIL